MIWYNNSQGPVDTSGPADMAVPDSGNFIFVYLDVPHHGDGSIMLSSDFCVSVENDTQEVLDVWAQIGVSNPSEDDRPMRPYHGVLHSVSRARILPGAMAVLHVIRLDVVDATSPWTMNRSPNGKYPTLAPQVFAPGGTRLCNCAARVVQIG